MESVINLCVPPLSQVQSHAVASAPRPARYPVPSCLSQFQPHPGPTSPAPPWSTRLLTLEALDTLRWSRASLHSRHLLQTQQTIMCCRWKPQGYHPAAFWSTRTQVGDSVPPCEHEKPEFSGPIYCIKSKSVFPKINFFCLVIFWFANEYSWLEDRITGWRRAALGLSVKLVVRPKHADQNALNRWERSVNIHRWPDTQLCTVGLRTELHILPRLLILIHSPLPDHVWVCPSLSWGA